MVSIIIPHFNRATLIKETVQSVLAQTNSNWELIIVDDWSDEKEFELISVFKNDDERIKVIKRQSLTKGPSACRNEGVAYSKGEYLLFLDSDDALAPFCVEQRLKYMQMDKTLHMGVFLMQEFNSKPGDTDKIYNNNSTYENRVNCFLEGHNPWAVTCPIWKKDFFLQCGRFDESFFYMEDPELHIRALLQEGVVYKTFYNLPADCFYRSNFHDDTKVMFYENSIRYRILFYKKTCNLINTNIHWRNSFRISLEKGVINFFSSFLLSRLKDFPNLSQDFSKWVMGASLLSLSAKLKIKFLSYIFKNDNIVFKTFRLKGIISKLLTTAS
jgi:glycosyltransferase involved in cell wall biosynthesis